MAKTKNSPIHNMRLVIYALVAFVALLVIAIISISTSYNNNAMTTDTHAASTLQCAKSATGQNRCFPGNGFKKVLVFCNDGTSTFTRLYSAANCGYLGTSNCMSQDMMNTCADSKCGAIPMCSVSHGIRPRKIDNPEPIHRPIGAPTPTNNPQVCYGANDCKKMGGAGCAGYKTCNPTTHCCENMPY